MNLISDCDKPEGGTKRPRWMMPPISPSAAVSVSGFTM
jgi:hypothetical protein